MTEPVLIVIDHPGPTFELRACCTGCGATISTRTYDTRTTRAEDVDLEAVLDGEAMRAHRCDPARQIHRNGN
jgi:hypothetical protein